MATNKVTFPWSAKGTNIKEMDIEEINGYRTENGIYVVSGFKHAAPAGGPKSGVWFKVGKTTAKVVNGKITGTNRVESYYKGCTDDARLHFFMHLEMRSVESPDHGPRSRQQGLKPYTSVYEDLLLQGLNTGNHPKIGKEKFFTTPRAMGSALVEMEKLFKKNKYKKGPAAPTTRSRK